MDTFEINRFLTVLIIIFIVYFIAKSLYKDVKTYPKIIWMYWDTKKLPHMIEKIKKYNEPKLKSWDVRFLNAETIYHYISKSEFPENYDKLLPAHKADWIRMCLLHKYGGCWMDAGIIINSPTGLDDIYDKMIKKQADLTVFKADINKDRMTFTHSSGKKYLFI
jgi:mannosyltransferase OCH1-like enzyme